MWPMPGTKWPTSDGSPGIRRSILDCDDGIEYSACLHEPTPQELLERMELFIRLWNALNSLPESQGRRIDAHIILGKSIKEIAEAEGVHEESVRQSIKRGLERMKKTF